MVKYIKNFIKQQKTAMAEHLLLESGDHSVSKSYKEPFLCMTLIVLMIFEVPYFKLFLVAGFLMLILYTIIYKRRPVVNGEMLVLLLFIVLYFMIDTTLEVSSEYKLWYAVSTVSLYACGYYMDYDVLDVEERSKKMEHVIRIIAIAYAAFILITVIYSVAKGQFGITRNPLNLWTGTLRAATHYGTMSVIPLAYGLYLVVIGETKKDHKLGWLLVLFTAFVATITASRTILFLIPIGAIIAYFANIKIRGKLSGKHLNQLIGALTLFTFGVTALALDVFGIQNLFLKSQLGQRYLLGYAPTLTDDGRWKNTTFFIQNISKSLWGGGYTRTNAGNIHNVYLNVFDLSGIIPFALLIIFTIKVVKDYKRMRKNKAVNISTALLLLLVLSLSFIQLLLEPTMESVPTFIWCLLLICGMQHKVSRYTNK